MSAPERNVSMPDLWEAITNLTVGFHGERGLDVVARAKSKDVNVCNLVKIELDGEGPLAHFPILRFETSDPRVQLVFSPHGSFQLTDML